MIIIQNPYERKGFVLTEVVLSLLLISFMLVPLFSLFASSDKIFSRSQEMTQVIFLAQGILEESRGGDIKYLAANRDFQVHPVFTNYQYRINITPYSGNNLFKITVDLKGVIKPEINFTLSSLIVPGKNDY